MLTPHDVRLGLAETRLAQRADVLAAPAPIIPNASHLACPRPQALPTAVLINKPTIAHAARIMGADLNNETPGWLRTSHQRLYLGTAEDSRPRSRVTLL